MNGTWSLWVVIGSQAIAPLPQKYTQSEAMEEEQRLNNQLGERLLQEVEWPPDSSRPRPNLRYIYRLQPGLGLVWEID